MIDLGIGSGRSVITLLRGSALRPGHAALALATRAVIGPAFRASALIAVVVKPAANERAVGLCVVCGEPVGPEDPFLRYRGEYYHAGACIELDPPALRGANPRPWFRGVPRAGVRPPQP